MRFRLGEVDGDEVSLNDFRAKMGLKIRGPITQEAIKDTMAAQNDPSKYNTDKIERINAKEKNASLEKIANNKTAIEKEIESNKIKLAQSIHGKDHALKQQQVTALIKRQDAELQNATLKLQDAINNSLPQEEVLKLEAALKAKSDKFNAQLKMAINFANKNPNSTAQQMESALSSNPDAEWITTVSPSGKGNSVRRTDAQNYVNTIKNNIKEDLPDELRLPDVPFMGDVGGSAKKPQKVIVGPNGALIPNPNYAKEKKALEDKAKKDKKAKEDKANKDAASKTDKPKKNKVNEDKILQSILDNMRKRDND
jgi:hypothetical protein